MEQNWSPWGPSISEIGRREYPAKRLEQKLQILKNICKRLAKRETDINNFQRGLRICQNFYRQYAARQIQQAWDRYWYRPNEKGESRAGKAGYKNIYLKF